MDSHQKPEDRHPKRTRDWVPVAESLKTSKRRRRRQRRQGLLLVLLALLAVAVLGALIAGAAKAQSPLNGICLLVLGVGAIALNRVLVEGGAVWMLLGVGTAPDPNVPSSHWYSPQRLFAVAVGLVLVLAGVAKI
jgi:cobalamin biosynthesis protein CobD/CbiB